MRVVERYGPIPSASRHSARRTSRRAFRSDKKTVQGKVHFVLPTKIGDVKIVTGRR